MTRALTRRITRARNVAAHVTGRLWWLPMVAATAAWIWGHQ